MKATELCGITYDALYSYTVSAGVKEAILAGINGLHFCRGQSIRGVALQRRFRNEMA